MKLVSKSTIGVLKNSDGILSSKASEKAELLQDVFCNGFTRDNGNILPCSAYTNNNLCDINFNPLLVERALRKLKVKTKGGPDGIPPIFLKNCNAELCRPLSILFNYSLRDTFLPVDWLRAYITPLFKKGVATDPNNYRPIALTATMSKTMETIVKDQLLNYIVSKGLISKQQHAFIKAHSTSSNLLECTHDWFVSLNAKCVTDVVYIDFSHAFDSIVFDKLTYKLELYGVSGKLLLWIAAFLHNRSQCVVIDNCFSTVRDVTSGVPQGSVLGPILFLIFINDIESACCGNTKLLLFADDAKLYTRVDVIQPSVSLQQSLDRLSAWAESWQLSINISKCSAISLGNKRSLLCSRSYFINGILLPSSTRVVDLGVTISNDLSFHTHINNIVAKAHQRISTFFRGFVSRNLLLVRKAFITYIRPLLEYNSIIWNPTHVYLIDLLESIQRKFSKRVPSLSILPYPDRIHRLDLESLEVRRLRFDLINYFKIFNSLSPIDPESHFDIYTPLQSSRSSMPYPQKPLRANTKLSSSFFYRNVDAWNYLPDNIKRSTSLTMFKAAIRKINLSQFLKGTSCRLPAF
jgi:hypothetical protein